MSPLPHTLSSAEGADDAKLKGLLGPTGMAVPWARGRLPGAPAALLLRGEERGVSTQHRHAAGKDADNDQGHSGVK